MSKKSEQFDYNVKFNEINFSIAFPEDTNPYPAILIPRTTSKIDKFLFYITENMFTPGIFKDNIRRKSNFISSNIVVLDIDDGSDFNSLQFKIGELKQTHGYQCFVYTTKSHRLQKGTSASCDRYRVMFFLSEPVNTPESYIATAKKLSSDIFQSSDDSACHDAARIFNKMTTDNEHFYMWFIKGKLVEPTHVTEPKKPMVKLKKELKSKITPILESDLKFYEDYLNSWFPRLKISHSNEDETINLFRNKQDNNPGVFMYQNGNKIYDMVDENEKVKKVPFSFNQVTEANKNTNIEALRQQSLSNITNKIDITKKFNIIISNEGLGKSSLVPNFLKVFNRNRIIIAMKSYAQIYNRKATLLKNNPELTSEIILGTERLLEKYNVSERIMEYNKEEGEWVLSFRLSVQASDIPYDKKIQAVEEKEYYDDICDGLVHKDILFMSEDKLTIEFMYRKRFRSDLILFDEFNQESWFSKRNPTAMERKRKKNGPTLFKQSTWSDNFQVELGDFGDMWYNYLHKEGRIIVLSTEEKVPLFFKNSGLEHNIIDERIVLKVTDNCHFNIVKQSLLTQKNKNKLATAFRVNDYIVVGNGINSTINNVTALGQNYHEEWSNGKVVMFITQPSPDEIAPLMANLGISSDEATILKMVDTANQLIGRAQGFRNNVNIKEMQILLPDYFAYTIMNQLRYVSTTNVKKTHKIESDNIVDKIIHTISVHELGHIKVANMYLSSLKDRISGAINSIFEIGISIVDTYKAFKFFSFNRLMEFKSRIHKANSLTNEMRKWHSIKHAHLLYSKELNDSNIELNMNNMKDIMLETCILQ